MSNVISRSSLQGQRSTHRPDAVLSRIPGQVETTTHAGKCSPSFPLYIV